MALNLFLRRIQQGAADGNALEADIKRVFMDYLQSDVISHWKEDIRSFLMQVSVVDAFTLELAEAITGEDDAASLLHRAEQAGNILQCDGEEWHIRPVLLEALREQALVVFGHKCIYQLMYNAGRYCETSGQTMRALRLYQRCGDADSIRSLLLREARKHPGRRQLLGAEAILSGAFRGGRPKRTGSDERAERPIFRADEHGKKRILVPAPERICRCLPGQCPQRGQWAGFLS